MSMWYSHATGTPSTDTQIITGKTREKWYPRWFVPISSLDKEHAKEGSLQGVFFSMEKILHFQLTRRDVDCIPSNLPEPVQPMLFPYHENEGLTYALSTKMGCKETWAAVGWLVMIWLTWAYGKGKLYLGVAKHVWHHLAHNRCALTTIRLCYLKYLKPCSQTLSVFNQLHMSRSLRRFLGNSTPDWGCQLECISKRKSACQSTP